MLIRKPWVFVAPALLAAVLAGGCSRATAAGRYRLEPVDLATLKGHGMPRIELDLKADGALTVDAAGMPGQGTATKWKQEGDNVSFLKADGSVASEYRVERGLLLPTGGKTLRKFRLRKE